MRCAEQWILPNGLTQCSCIIFISRSETGYEQNHFHLRFKKKIYFTKGAKDFRYDVSDTGVFTITYPYIISFCLGASESPMSSTKFLHFNSAGSLVAKEQEWSRKLRWYWSQPEFWRKLGVWVTILMRLCTPLLKYFIGPVMLLVCDYSRTWLNRECRVKALLSTRNLTICFRSDCCLLEQYESWCPDLTSHSVFKHYSQFQQSHIPMALHYTQFFLVDVMSCLSWMQCKV